MPARRFLPDASAMTTLHYEITSADQLAKLERFVSESKVGRSFAWFAYVVIVGLAWSSAVLFYVKQGDQHRGYLVYGAFAAFLTLALPSLYRWYQASFWRSVLSDESLRGLVGPTTLTLSAEGIEEARSVTTVRATWTDVVRIDRDRARTFIVLAPLIAIVIPVHAFLDDASRTQFEQQLAAGVAAAASAAR
jgi:hypothetical protein